MAGGLPDSSSGLSSEEGAAPDEELSSAAGWQLVQISGVKVAWFLGQGLMPLAVPWQATQLSMPVSRCGMAGAVPGATPLSSGLWQLVQMSVVKAAWLLGQGLTPCASWHLLHSPMPSNWCGMAGAAPGAIAPSCAEAWWQLAHISGVKAEWFSG